MASYAQMGQFLGTLGNKKPKPPAWSYQPNYGEREGPVKSAIPQFGPGKGQAAPTTLGVPGYTTPGTSLNDYMSNFSDDPEYRAAVGELGAASQADRSQMLNAIK